MTMASARQVATTGNPREHRHPGYKTKDVTFDQALGQKLLPLNSTYKTHIGASGSPQRPMTEVAGLAERRDGNNVQVDRELMNINSASGDFAAAQTALAAKFRLVRYALNESR
jgi:flagellar basal-body rod protein FlgB